MSRSRYAGRRRSKDDEEFTCTLSLTQSLVHVSGRNEKPIIGLNCELQVLSGTQQQPLSLGQFTPAYNIALCAVPVPSVFSNIIKRRDDGPHENRIDNCRLEAETALVISGKVIYVLDGTLRPNTGHTGLAKSQAQHPRDSQVFTPGYQTVTTPCPPVINKLLAV